MGRLIDADVLWMDVIHSVDYCDDILEFIERQPTVEQWIPLSERLPRKGEQVLCSNKKGSVFTSAYTYTDSRGVAVFGQHLDVIAWAELPEPYTEEAT